MAKIVHNLDSPGSLLKAVAVVPNDQVDLPFTARAIFVGGGGTLSVIMANDDDNGAVTLTGIGVGSIHRLAVRRVMATGTTATLIVAFA